MPNIVELPQGQFYWLITFLLVFGYIFGRLHEYLHGRWAYGKWRGLLEQAQWMQKKMDTQSDGTFFDGEAPSWEEESMPRVVRRDKGWRPYSRLPNDIREKAR